MNTTLQTQMKAAPGPSFTPIHTGLLQRKCASNECEERRKKRLNLQRSSTNETEPSEVPPIVHDVLRSPGQPLDPKTRAFMEPHFGHDFSKVRVHTDAKAAESARAVNALAYTVGMDVVFGAGQYAPGTSDRLKLIAHELTHVVHQAPSAVKQPLGVTLSHNDLEIEANRNASSVTAGASAAVHLKVSGSPLMKQLPGPKVAEPGQVRRRARDGKRPTREQAGLTKQQVARDEYLRGIAARPMFALEHWRRLRPGEQTVVMNYMTIFYGRMFATRFYQVASRQPHPETVVTITNFPSVTPEYLRQRGYALAETVVGTQIWVHPSGNETWVILLSTGTAEVKEREGAQEQDPGVKEAQDYADNFTAARDRLVDQLAELRRKIGTPEYTQLYHQYFQDFTDWQEQLNPIIDERITELEREVDPQEQPKLREQIHRLRELIRWKQEEWPQSVRDLPPP